MIDIIIIIMFAGAIIYGFRKGIICQLGAVIALVAGIVACRIAGDSSSSVVLGIIGKGGETPSQALAYSASVVGKVFVFLVVYTAVKLGARGLRKVTHLMLMGPVDRVLGAIFTLFEWFTALSIALNLWMALFPSSNLLEKSTIGGGVAIESVMELSPWLLGTLSATTGVDIPSI